ncbi:cactin isoform X2, partial [Tachysurus ichikawai]
SKIRIRDGRAKPIDLLAKYISAEDDDLSVEMHEPYTFLNGLKVTDMDDLLEDIKQLVEELCLACAISNLDIGYWESLMQQVRVYMARARLRERHQDVLRQKLYKLKQEQGVESEPLFPIIKEETDTENPRCESGNTSNRKSPMPLLSCRSRQRRVKTKRKIVEMRSQGRGAVESMLTEEDLIQHSQAEYSPGLLQLSELPLGTCLQTAAGFEWNKYNQTRYDFENPPCKIVQGYKFNIFYPDLIDKRSVPQYVLEPNLDNKGFGILRFQTGPPYEDIAR